MHEPTPNDTPREPPSVWYELAAVEIEVGSAGHIVKLPPAAPGALEPWRVCDTHPGQKNIGGKPRQILTVCFARQISAGEPIAQKPKPIEATRPAPPAAKAPPPRAVSPAGSRRVQPGPTVGVPKPLVTTPSDVVSAVENTVAGVVEAVASGIAGTVGEVLSGLGVAAPGAGVGAVAAPVNIPQGQGCTCPEPVPAVQNSTAAAIPCRACGGWIDNAQPAEQPTA